MSNPPPYAASITISVEEVVTIPLNARLHFIIPDATLKCHKLVRWTVVAQTISSETICVWKVKVIDLREAFRSILH